jgi:hypothetical protein
MHDIAPSANRLSHLLGERRSKYEEGKDFLRVNLTWLFPGRYRSGLQNLLIVMAMNWPFAERP